MQRFTKKRAGGLTMLIDWLSLKISLEYFDVEQVRHWQAQQDKIVKISRDGVHIWETCAWDSVRSDSHQLAFQITANHIRIQGSPARIIGDGDNVFSAGAAAALDLVGCQSLMVRFIAQHTGVDLPVNPKLWDVTRVDVTENLFLGSLAAVRQALSILRDCEGGRYRVSQQAGDSVYWSHRSRLRSGKAYAKGAELIHKMKQASTQKLTPLAREYSLYEIQMASGLLRLELKLGAQYWRERSSQKWHLTQPDDLKHEWESYFSRMIGGAEIMHDQDIYSRLLKVVDIDDKGKPRESQAKAAFSLWCLIKSEGWEKSKAITTKTTWYRNIKHLRNAGLSDADISKGNIVQLRQKVLQAVPVTSWEQLHNVYQLAA
ncbi:hypothetical protein HMY34_19635 [Thiothrix subterranea]|uniref:phage/plasmid replication protein, II/X family n=1 Tax=Thiothrix subterranea TaxID=2735563 RepID=UPI00192AF70D|nr:phage/plasmid replication protein, II/X family [Thiothrix subterranea]QQZ30787.1 hypothetical protein HMY34_19635 [Thiothrix subterranea]